MHIIAFNLFNKSTKTLKQLLKKKSFTQLINIINAIASPFYYSLLYNINNLGGYHANHKRH